ncbi:uncharacterized protein CTRU02_214663 [Colletotrichum truncatum]|uniref:Uncharacterized protein n=1 Tax=Colletotrichum truncatum TaxID=5467 RepID=A0ACC3YFB6_COLTU|nr:uncharacterized protein CTRU02_09611 [Colletotrichum truncatum]KAF6788293.1 hypothetical protein CTRU02_09611 [Colletotrichum truncatum]
MEPENVTIAHEVTQSDDDCKICASLRQMLATPEFSLELGGPIDEIIAAASCPGHNPLFCFIRDEYNSFLLQEFNPDGERQLEAEETGGHNIDTDVWKAHKTILCHNENEPHGGIFVQIRDGRGVTWSMILGRSKYETQTSGFGRILDPDWIDLSLVKRWKNDCSTYHGEKCRNPLHIRQVSPAWLIDTSDKCLVPGDGITDFVALSYRWGGSVGFKATCDVLEIIRQPGGLSPNKIEIGLPKIIRHAMELVQELDERYLWVDAVCIVQDQEVHLREQLQLMGAIYSSATLTIVAADGDATVGLRGLKGISSSREFAQGVIPVFQDEKVIIRNEPVLRQLTGCDEYFDRGWTYQEYYLSKRRLIFSRKQIYWQCSGQSWSEDLIDDRMSAKSRDEWFGELAALMVGVPKYEVLYRWLSEYNNRILSYPEDALPGITGFLAVLSRSFAGGFLFGLAESSFDSLLLWHAQFNVDMERRKHSGKENLSKKSPVLPSWSWIGWRCFALRVPKDETFELGDAGQRTIPITQWYTHETPDAAVRRQIKSSWFNIWEDARKPDFQVPGGWTRERYDDEKHGPARGNESNLDPPEGLGEYVYHHSSLRGRYFWLPLPVSTLNEDVEPFSTPQTAYISCLTTRGWFMATRFPDDRFTEHDRAYNEHLFVMRLLDADGKDCGELKLHREEDNIGFVEADSESVPEAIELVAICKSRSPEVASKDKIHVLWVEWVSGVAYRKAAGFVWLEDWERHKLEVIHLVLG